MKLQLISTKEVFDAPRGIGLALIQTGTVEEYKTPIVPPNWAVDWKVCKSTNSDRYYISFYCNRCKMGASPECLRPINHCGRLEDVPDDIAEKFLKLQPAPVVRERSVPTNLGQVTSI